MLKHLEIEFKTLISKEQYDLLMKDFDLENKAYSQTNYYFDSKNFDLRNKKTVLRIRKKEQFKLTKKEKAENGNEETSIFLTDDEALKMIEKGFDASIINEPYYVNLITSLTTLRAKKGYMCGEIFFDKSTYNGHTDYEIEFEVTNIKEGKIAWLEFLNKYKIEKKNPISKSKRAFDTVEKK